MKVVQTVVVILLLSGCIAGKKGNSNYKNVPGNYCVPAVAFHYSTDMKPVNNIDSLLDQDPSLAKHFSSHDLLLANAVGILTPLQQIQVGMVDTSLTGKVRYLELRQRLSDWLILAVTELQSIAAELDCEGERADQLGAYLDDRHDKRVRKLTVWSVVLGAVTTVATTLINNDNAQKITGITGGVASAGLGIMSAFPDNRKAEFMHRRNLLRPLWYGTDSLGIYPPFIWYILNNKQFSNNHTTSIAYNIKNRWLIYEFDNHTDKNTLDLLFGEGGMYKADDLHTRANMLNQLQSTIRSVNQDLQSFILSFREEYPQR
ncbi:hypothetical protein SAMN05518672_101379 [Chitinophaga sp. CF118]|uniref:hypothetical protein n=1 Tax=Chitinophaga sp. CF118 TaxID=1884367 RepID=UPI0008E5AB05|nr:hypothetical protein [Chitinophaga sp. CF118]SFD08339.1 hypothetical protein SAMN05518672_101379 [Chitinophaga sp. CF118]